MSSEGSHDCRWCGDTRTEPGPDVPCHRCNKDGPKVEVKWIIGGGLPTADGWYIVAKDGRGLPSLMWFGNPSHRAWEHVIAWYGPINIPMEDGIPSNDET